MENQNQLCCICESEHSLIEVNEKWICEDCLHAGNEKLVFPWKNVLEKLMKEYSEACSKFIESYDPREIHKAKIVGKKIRTIFEFLRVPKKQSIFYAFRKMNQFLCKLRGLDVLLDEMLGQTEEKIVYNEMVRLIRKKQKKLHKLVTEEFPAIMNESFFDKIELFLNKELKSYVLPLERKTGLVEYEERFIRFQEHYHQSTKEKGKTALETVESIQSVRKIAKSLRYLFNILNEIFGENYQDKETYYKSLQLQLSKIRDAEDWLQQIKKFQSKIDAPKKEIQNVKKELKAKLKQLLEEVELPEMSVDGTVESH
jgi:CHAD domain-containing protein